MMKDIIDEIKGGGINKKSGPIFLYHIYKYSI